jgi:hypothetical protein
VSQSQKMKEIKAINVEVLEMKMKDLMQLKIMIRDELTILEHSKLIILEMEEKLSNLKKERNLSLLNKKKSLVMSEKRKLLVFYLILCVCPTIT